MLIKKKGIIFRYYFLQFTYIASVGAYGLPTFCPIELAGESESRGIWN